MKKTLKLAVPMAALATLLSLSAFAEPRHRDETWRTDRNDRQEERRDRRDARYDDDRRFLSGYVERVDHRRDVIVLREAASGRRYTVDMDRTDRRDRRNRIELDEVRRGDFITLTGEWRRNGVFEAFRITEVRDPRRRW